MIEEFKKQQFNERKKKLRKNESFFQRLSDDQISLNFCRLAVNRKLH